MPNQGALVFFGEFIDEILDFFESGEKKKIMLQHTETIFNPAVKKGIKIPVIPGSKVFIDILLMLTPEYPVLAHKVRRVSYDTVARIVRKFLQLALNISFVDEI